MHAHWRDVSILSSHLFSVRSSPESCRLVDARCQSALRQLVRAGIAAGLQLANLRLPKRQ
jgi:hypothetical protein